MSTCRCCQPVVEKQIWYAYPLDILTYSMRREDTSTGRVNFYITDPTGVKSGTVQESFDFMLMFTDGTSEQKTIQLPVNYSSSSESNPSYKSYIEGLTGVDFSAYVSSSTLYGTTTLMLGATNSTSWGLIEERYNVDLTSFGYTWATRTVGTALRPYWTNTFDVEGATSGQQITFAWYCSNWWDLYNSTTSGDVVEVTLYPSDPGTEWSFTYPTRRGSTTVILEYATESLPTSAVPGCRWGTNTGQRWCANTNTRMKITCSNPQHIQYSRDGVVRGASSLYEKWDTDNPDVLYVKSDVCCQQHCLDFEESQ